MGSAIDATKPAEGAATTQSVRDNFATAKSEISALQVQAAAAEAIGDYAESIIGTSQNFSASGMYKTATSLLIPAGAQDIDIDLMFIPNGAIVSQVFGALGTEDGNSGAGIIVPDVTAYPAITAYPATANKRIRLNLTSPATRYLKVYAIYSAGQPQYRVMMTRRKATAL